MAKKNTKIKPYLKGCKCLTELPYNKLNLDNYVTELEKTYKIQVLSVPTKEDCPIKLMSGQHPGAKIVTSGLSYQARGRNIILVGKGILFDAGGYNLKRNMKTMKQDMAGMSIAFAVASYFKNVKGKDNVIAYCPVSTNFIHNNNIIPGDYIKVGKKEIEITNTDAEGRLILAEALTDLKPKKNDIVITIATLTGSCSYALGKKATAVLSPNPELIKKYLSSSKKAKELAWELPLWEYCQKKFNKKRIKNYDSSEDCGTIMAGMFIQQFAKYPKNWIHLDVAYSAYDDSKNVATGEPVVTLIEFIKTLT